MYPAIKGIYENGSLKLLEPAPNVEKTEVLVMFLKEQPTQTVKKGVRLGSMEGKYTLPDDFNDPLEDLSEYM